MQPTFFLEPGPMREGWRELEAYLAGFLARLAEHPNAILVVSGHWKAPVPTVDEAARPPLLFDCDGFPDPAYRLTWPAPGVRGPAARVRVHLAIGPGLRSLRHEGVLILGSGKTYHNMRGFGGRDLDPRAESFNA